MINNSCGNYYDRQGTHERNGAVELRIQGPDYEGPVEINS